MLAGRSLVRPRLLELAGARWSHRVTVIVAGPGFGKSTLLAQLSAEHRLSPRGTEVLVACAPGDADPRALTARLLAAVPDHRPNRRQPPLPPSPADVLAELAARWPLGVCVVLDDVHHVAATADGARLLATLLRDAPPPVRFVLASRHPVRGLGALRARGDVLELDDTDLALTPLEAEELAAAHGADPAAVIPWRHWPAVAAIVAAYGIHGVGDYVWDAVLEHLDDRQRRVLAAAAALGPCPTPVLAHATGEPPDVADALAGLPLVARVDGQLVVHDLLHDALRTTLTDDERHGIVGRAIDALVDEVDAAHLERAHRLATAHRRWDDVARVVRACCRGGHPLVSTATLTRWLDALPADRHDEPEGLLLRSLLGRALEPFAATTADLLGRAAAVHRALGDADGEVAAINELAYVLRIQGRGADLPALIARAGELQAAGHHGLDALLAMGGSVWAELTGDAAGVVTALDVVASGALDRDWAAVFAFRRTIGHLTTGETERMLAAGARCAELADGATLRHANALARWFAGDPVLALDSLDEIVEDCGRSAVDALVLGAFATMVLASAGRLPQATERLRATEVAAQGGPIVPLMRGYLVGIRALTAAAAGDDTGARAVVEQALTEAPIDDAVGWMAATRWLPLAYVLVPSTRAVIDGRELGDLHARRIAVARAVAAALDGRPLPCGADALSPDLIATTVPLPWSMALAARLHADGSPVGRRLAHHAMERFGPPARDALRTATERRDRRVRDGARKLLASVALPPPPVRLSILGPTQLELVDAAPGPDWQRERVRSLLTYLVLHGPSRRESITDALWPDLDPAAADRNLRVTLSYLQRVLEPERQRGEAPFLVRQEGPCVVVAGPPYLDVDRAELEAHLDRADAADRAGAPSIARQHLAAAAAVWRGPVLADVAYEEWAQPTRQAVTDRYVRAMVRAGELGLAAGDVTAAARDARRALVADEWCEPAHRVLIACAVAAGDRAGAARALSACERVLDDLGVTPAPETVMLARQLRQRATPAIAAA